jgi:cation diffusion facilitator CzcD-associated flavoprotein CzcO
LNYVSSTESDFVIAALGSFDSRDLPNSIIDLTRFPGTLMHSSDNRSLEQVRDKQVILAGASMRLVSIWQQVSST